MTRRRTLATDHDRGPVVRLSVDAMIGSRVFERIVVDVATRSEQISPPEAVQLGQIVVFAGLPLVEMPVINLRAHWAEKLSAYVRRYGDRPNTRVKDLLDLVLLVEHGLLPNPQLFEAVEETFTAGSNPFQATIWHRWPTSGPTRTRIWPGKLAPKSQTLMRRTK